MTAALLRARDYAKAYGWLAGAVEQFLRGEITKSELLRLTGEAEAIAQGTRVTQGGKRRGESFEPSLVRDVPTLPAWTLPGVK